jgi:hypothetical protein
MSEVTARIEHLGDISALASIIETNAELPL